MGQPIEGVELAAVRAELCRVGRAAHPDVELSDADFVAHLDRCGAPVAAGAAAVQAGDLFLTCAALGGCATAVKKLRGSHRPVVARYLRSIDGSSAFVDDVEQQLWNELLVGERGAAPKLVGYSGKGTLAGFVGISAQRIALTMLRKRAAEARAVEGAAPQKATAAGADQEVAFIKNEYRDGFQRAIEEALRVLSDRERLIFRMHFVEGVTVARIANVYQVSQSTLSRWLADGRRRILAEARRVLREILPVSDGEFDSIARLLVSQLDISLSLALAGDP